MKRIIATVRPAMLDNVVAALNKMESFPGAGISETKRVLRGTNQSDKNDPKQFNLDFPHYIRLEIICRNGLVADLVETIRWSAHTGKPGDGKIIVSPIESAIRISDGLTDKAAL
jgi:nitrogen regulatory protein P-II 1